MQVNTPQAEVRQTPLSGTGTVTITAGAGLTFWQNKFLYALTPPEDFESQNPDILPLSKPPLPKRGKKKLHGHLIIQNQTPPSKHCFFFLTKQNVKDCIKTLVAFIDVFPQRGICFFGGRWCNKQMLLQIFPLAVLTQLHSHWIMQKVEREEPRWHEPENIQRISNTEAAVFLIISYSDNFGSYFHFWHIMENIDERSH